MGKVIEFKKFSKNINKDSLNVKDYNIDIFPEEDLAYVRKEIHIKLDEINELLNCIYKQILVNDNLIAASERENNFDKTIYLKDYNDKMHDVMYFLTNSVYQEPIIINLNFLEFEYLLGTLQLQIDLLEDSQNKSKDSSTLAYFNVIENLYNRLTPVYNTWKEEIYKK